MKLILIMMTLFTGSIQAQDIIEAGIDQIFTIKNGFDSNDQIELVIDSTLPDACYRVGKTTFKIVENNIYIKQNMRVKSINRCILLERDIKQFPKMPVNFTKVLNLGALPAGQYFVNYKNQDEELIKKELIVKATVNQTVDDYYYAPITDVFIPALVYNNQNATLIMTGIINDSCLIYEPKDFKVIKQNNIFIVQPKVRFIANETCIKVQKPLQAVINLGKIPESGRYLVHVRAMSGQSINKTFSVEKQQVDRRRE